jgi:polysaccharide export outer membrane protein
VAVIPSFIETPFQDSETMKSFLTILTVLACAVVPVLGEIQIGKAVKISILGVPAEEKGRIDGDYSVADNGTINMPFIGEVRAAGLKAEVLQKTLEARYRGAQIFRNPTFQVVSDTEGAGLDENFVHVAGQVGRNGPVKFNRGMTLFQAITAAGGPNAFGTMKRVKLLRAGQQRIYDLTELQNMQIPLEVNDMIEVPQKRPWDIK